MKSWKFKVIFPLVLVTILAAVYYSLWHFPISSGKRVGNLTKISKKGNLFKTWEGTIDEGSELTSNFSVRDEKIASELFEYEGREVRIYYKQYIVGWPWETDYDVVSWKPNIIDRPDTLPIANGEQKLTEYVGKTLFCSLLGSLFADQELYQKVKNHLQQHNLYLYKQIKTCNE